ncbi:hypothetical protein AJ79_00969 [Helicocarpus griseus UAMH5409]|uniref:Alpha and gamma adaptin binding protein p34 n=1 Tax=Helicocarpus griseus UAMH5409 TaxID=1447875 RepID=A0A2B7Y9L3_9EURO|nr:hypothetical protein AJ79_00969 [Helicocarpus griseus UAMH5409]
MTMPSPPSQQEKTPNDIKTATRILTPRRLLILTPASQSHAIVPPFLHSLTGVAVTHAPQAPNSAQLDENVGSINHAAAEGDSGLISTFAGYTTHSPLRIETKYYTADIPIWVDELPFSSASTSTSSTLQSSTTNHNQQHTSSTWRSEFLSEEAREVRDVIGAVIICIERPSRIAPEFSQPREHKDRHVQGLKELLSAVAEVRNQIEEERGSVGEVPGLVVLVGKDEEGKDRVNGLDSPELGNGAGGEDGLEEIVEFSTRWWEEELSEMGHFELEVVAWDPKGEDEREKRNMFGELEGIPRIKEVLRTNEWGSGGQGDFSADFLLDSDEEAGFDKEASELEREMFGLKLAIEKGGDVGASGDSADVRNEEGDDELHVEKMDGLMMRMQAIKDMASELPEAERKAFAVKAINDIMKDM